MIKDAGYYYDGFDVHDGYEQLKKAIESHDENLDAYNTRSENVLERYTIFNKDLIVIYDRLLKDLMAGKRTHGLSHEYDWQTNLYK